MAKKLPSKKKGLKSFILDEDAKVIDKTATKIAITSSFISFSIIDSIEEGNAFLSKHSNHENHNNHINSIVNEETGMHAGNNPTGEAQSEGTLTPKSVTTAHANHFNHQDQSEGQSGWWSVIAVVVAAAAGAFTGGTAGVLFYAAMGSSLAASAALAGVSAVIGGIIEYAFLDKPDLVDYDGEIPYIIEPEILNEILGEYETHEGYQTEGYDGSAHEHPEDPRG